jgi:phage FluMu protein gp41
MAKTNASYAATASMLNSGYNSTINQMAAIGNMSGPRYKVR